MADDLPGYSRELGAGKPLTRSEWKRRERERKALDVYTRTFSYPQVRKQCGLRSNEVAREVVQAAWERYEEEEGWAGQMFRKAQREAMAEMHVILLKAARGDGDKGADLGAIDRLLKVWERMAKLEALDKQREEVNVENNWTIVATPPWMRQGPPQEIVEGEVVEEAGDGE